MSQIILGKSIVEIKDAKRAPGQYRLGPNVSLDIPLALTSRLLVQANSGGGKSWLLRRIAEQLYGKVQTIILDPEGEFFTLRDKFGYVLVGEGGETPADVRSAELLAQKFMELKISAVCDLYEAFRSRPTERRQWVRLFLNALLEVPRTMWRPLVVIVDEAHKFCPQETPKAGDQREREIISGCKDAMIAFATTGRKRGFCAVWATQRLAKVDKDATAELFNRLVGMTIEDVDLDRAADLMSVSKEDKSAFRSEMRNLEPGEFYAFGRAISKVRVLFKSGPIETRHPESGAAAKHSEPPPMPDAVAKLLPKLGDLPKQAEEKARTEAEYKREIRELRTKVAQAERAAAKPIVVAPKVAMVTKLAPDPRAIEVATARAVSAAIKQRDGEWGKTMQGYKKQIAELRSQAERASRSVPAIRKAMEETANAVGLMLRPELAIAPPAAPAPPPPAARVPMPQVPAHVKQSSHPAPPDVKPIAHSVAVARLRVPQELLAAGEQPPLRQVSKNMAGVLAAYYPEPLKREVLAALMGLRDGGNFSARLSDLRIRGWLDEPGRGIVKATEECAREFAGAFQAPTSTDEVLALWKPKLRDVCGQMLDFLVQQYPRIVRRDELAAAVGLADGGNFSARLSDIRLSGLIVEPGRGQIQANHETLFLSEAAA